MLSKTISLHRDCSWVLKAPYGKRIALHFYSMQLESHTDCNADYLAVRSSEQISFCRYMKTILLSI